jgi:hypothetical protein
MAVFEREYTVVVQACRTSPNHDVAMLQGYTPLPILAGVAAEEEYGRQAQ